ncbi:unnamed protein product [Fraxinus pennsylvanica]|uniref:Uncharacterized protein n=1 Tax=Fraxinus pennsylvanica TaxID=56036 RepID=A0AAD2DLM2_9LAMI|nr:unnamed protein product [Fraxinus pennsylvanica]
MVLFLERIHEPLQDPLLQIRIVNRFITLSLNNIYCYGAGTAADTKAVTDMVSSQIKLHRYHTGRKSRVVTSLSLLKSHHSRSANEHRACFAALHTIYPHGSMDTFPFATMGSGSLAAMAVFKSKYRKGFSLSSLFHSIDT